MSADKALEGLRRDAARIAKDGHIVDAYFEAHALVLVTDTPDAFTRETIAAIAKTLRKRVLIRTAPDARPPAREAEAKLREVVPPDARIEALQWRDDGSVLIEALSPGDAIGAKGATLQKIRDATGWAPEVVRAPNRPSQIIELARQLDHADLATRAGEFIHASARGRQVSVEPVGHGACIKTKEATIALDAESEADAIVLTSADARVDLDAIIEGGFHGPFYATPPTRDLLAAGLQDPAPFLERTLVIGWNEPTDIGPGVRLTLQPSGRMLGASVAHLHLSAARQNVVFAGGLRTQRSAVCPPASGKFPRVDFLILPDPEEPADEAVILDMIGRASQAGPVTVAIDPWQVGEALLMLEPLGGVQVSPALQEALAIHTAYVEYFNEGLRQRWQREDPFAHVGDGILLTTPDEAEGTIIMLGSGEDRAGTIRIGGFAAGADKRHLLNYVTHLDPKPGRIAVLGEGKMASKLGKRSRVLGHRFDRTVLLGDDAGDGVEPAG